jgi:hypothetical protein
VSWENGSSTGITLASFIKLLRAIDLLDEMEKLLPELPESQGNAMGNGCRVSFSVLIDNLFVI